MADSGNAPQYIKFIFASISGIAATVLTYPMDVLKFRMQVSGELGRPADHKTVVQFTRGIFSNEGFRGLYGGLSAAIVRQSIYTGTRLGSYQMLMDYFRAREGTAPTIIETVFSSIVAGVVGGVVGVPPDIAMTRMAIDGRLPRGQRRNYKNVFDALIRIYREEGFFTLFRGTLPTIIRTVIINVSQFVTYSQAKIFLIDQGIPGDSNINYLLSSMMATCVTTVCVMPADIAKTRIQNMYTIDGKRQYTGILNVWSKMRNFEGIRSLWKGSTPIFFASLPKSTLLFIFYENQFKLYRKFVQKPNGDDDNNKNERTKS